MRCNIIIKIVLMMLFVGWSPLFAQQLSVSVKNMLESDKVPFSPIISLPIDSLESMGFTFDKRKNLYELKSHSKQTKRDKLWRNLVTRNSEDYELYIYLGGGKKSIIQICFYDPIIFEGVKQWAEKYTDKPLVVKGKSAESCEFRVDDIKYRLTMEKKKVSGITLDNSFSLVLGTMDDTPLFFDNVSSTRTTSTYYLYTLTALTGIKPESKWLERQQQKIREQGLKRASINTIL